MADTRHPDLAQRVDGAPDTPPQGDITCLFTDIEGSTALSKRLTPQDFRRVTAEHDDRLPALIRQNNGYEVDNPGDGFFATFQHSADALRCAVAIQQSLDAQPIEAMLKDDDEPIFLCVRIGISRAAREVFVNEASQYRDREVNLAARIGELGVGGQIIVNDDAYEKADNRDYYKWEHFENRYVRDHDTPQTLHELRWDNGPSQGEPGARWTPSWLLRETNKFVGREEILCDVVQWLKGDRPLLLLHGPGGIGKTRLAAQAVMNVGSHFEGRIYGVALDREFGTQAESVTPAQVALRVAASLDSPSAPDEVINLLAEAISAPDNEAVQTKALEALIDRLSARKPFLLVLDNWESVNNPHTCAWLSELARRVNRLRILVTSRFEFQLHSISESREIEPLKIPTSAQDDLEAFEGFQLFRERAEQDQPPPDLSDRASLVRILQMTEGNALGIELVAARCSDYPLARIAEGLKQSRLKWQRTQTDLGDVPGLARHESIEICFDWSFQLLLEVDRQLYPRLSLFPADFDAQAAQRIAEIPEERLLFWRRAHLLPWSDAVRKERFVLPPVLREFAENRLPLADREPLRGKYVAYYVGIAEANEDMNKPEQRLALGVELRNLHASAEYLCEEPSRATDAGRSLNSLGYALWQIPIGLRTENLQRAIACCEAAQRVYNKTDFPILWAGTQNNLGTIYRSLPIGDRTENLQKAITYCEAARRVYTEADFPIPWAGTQNNLGTAYLFLPTGVRTENLQRAITYFNAARHVYTEVDFPYQWAMCQHNLGNAYRDLPTGDRSLNLQRAITCYEDTLRVYTEAKFPSDWAMTQINLGAAYGQLPMGDREENLQRAIACFEAALYVYTEADFPFDWANTQNNLGNAYSILPTGDRTENLQRAIVCYEAALHVYTETDFPSDWAMTQNNLGNAYLFLPAGDRGQNLQHAITCYEDTLRVYTEAKFPSEWAGTQNNLGNAFSEFLRGDRRLNLQRAIDCYEAALRMRTEAKYPYEWADTHFNLALVYREQGDESSARQALENAIRGYRAVGAEQDAQEVEAILSQLRV